MDLNEIRIKLPIDKLGEALGIKVEKESARWAFALCPFHHDTDPSFAFDKRYGYATCFSSNCADLGKMDHISLIQHYEHLPREAAIDRLYQIMGEERPVNSLHDVLAKVLGRLTENVDMDIPKAFFESRGISREALQELMVGYSPSFEWLKGIIADISMEDAAKLEFYRVEMFNNSIIYPLFDGLGRVAGFRARNFSTFSKYIANNKDYPLKPGRIYGMHLVKGRQMVLVEGPNDVLALRSAGMKNVGGLMGLDLKRDLGGYLENCGYSDAVLLTDGDDAGRIAMLQAPDLIRVNQIPQGDPDEFVKSKGVMALASLAELINAAKYPFEIKLESRLQSFRGNTLTAKMSLVRAIAKDISEGLPTIIIMRLKDKIASALEISTEEVESIFELAEYDTTDLEEKVIWHLFEKGEHAQDILSKVHPNAFTNTKLRTAYNEILGGFSPADAPIKREGLTAGDIEKFIDIANRRYMKVEFVKASHAIMNLAQPLDEVLGKALTKMANISTEDIVVVTSAQLMDTGIQNAIERSKHPNELLGIPFGEGFVKTDAVLQGLRPQSLYILAANQGVGKSALAFDWAINMAFMQHVPTLWVSLEMSELEMSIRLLAKLTGASATRLMTGANIAELPTFAQQAINHAGAPFFMADCGVVTITQLVALIRKYKLKHGIKVVYVDYIQLISGGYRTQNMYERLGYISGMLKSAINKDRSIALPVVALAQLTRGAAKHESHGTLATGEDLAESYKIAQDADAILTIRQRSEKEIENDALEGQSRGNMVMYVAKNRAGIGGIQIPLLFDKESLKIREALT